MQAQLLSLLEQGLAAHQKGELAVARPYYEQCLALDAGLSDAWYLLGVLLSQSGNLDTGIAHLQKALSLDPNNAVYHYNLGCLYEESGNSAAAEKSYLACLTLNPQHAQAMTNLGSMHAEAKRFDQALAYLQEALRVDPGNVQAWNNFGNLQRDYLQNYEQAEYAFKQAGDAKGMENLAELYLLLNRLTEALPLLLQCELMAAPAQKHRYWARIVWLKHSLVEWSQLADYRAKLEAHIDESIAQSICPSIEPFQSLVMRFSPATQRAIAELYAAKHYPPVSATPRKPRQGKIRIGYLSADFHDHPTAQLMGHMLRYHDRDRFEVFAYALEADDGSEWRQHIQQDADHFRALDTLSFHDAQACIRNDALDILMDVKGHTRFARPDILAARIAPVQVGFLAYPGSMGRLTDYAIADSIVAPPHEAPHYSEKLLYLDGTYFIADGFDLPRLPTTLTRRPNPAETIFCSFNNSYKIDPAIFQAWMSILQQTPNSFLWLMAPLPEMQQNLLREAAEQGIAPTRLRFVGRTDRQTYLSHLAEADLFLDCSMCNAHTTAIDALAVGLPIITLTGQNWANRACTSILTSLGLEVCATDDIAHYIRLATQLAREPDKLATLKQMIIDKRQQPGNMFDGAHYVKKLEALLLTTLA